MQFNINNIINNEINWISEKKGSTSLDISIFIYYPKLLVKYKI